MCSKYEAVLVVIFTYILPQLSFSALVMSDDQLELGI